MNHFPLLDSKHRNAVRSNPGVALIDFWQASCPPCVALEPRLEAFSDRHPGEFDGYRVDVGIEHDAVASFGVMTIPTLILLRDGREVARLDGLIRDEDLEEALRRAHST